MPFTSFNVSRSTTCLESGLVISKAARESLATNPSNVATNLRESSNDFQSPGLCIVLQWSYTVFIAMLGA